MLKKLESLGAEATSLPLNVLKENLMTLEAVTGKLPDSYRTFLLHFGVAILFDVNIIFKALKPSPWADDKGHDSLESLYGLTESGREYTVFEVADTYQDDFRDQWLAIGVSSGDNQICICLNGAMFGQIWYWDHETDPVFNENEVISGMTKITNSFEEFVELLDIKDEKSDTSGIIKIELDF